MYNHELIIDVDPYRKNGDLRLVVGDALMTALIRVGMRESNRFSIVSLGHNHIQATQCVS